MSEVLRSVRSEETPVYFRAGPDTLFGIYSRAAGDGPRPAMTMLTGGGHLTLTHRNRLHVLLARRLAELGIDSFRFDFHGTGESTGLVERFRVDRPFTEDLAAAVSLVDGRAVTGHLLMGTCFGARTVLSQTDRIPRLQGAVLISPPIRDLAWGDPAALRRVLRWDVWRRLRHRPAVRRALDSRPAREARRWLVPRARAARDALGRRARTRGEESFGWVGSGFLRPLRGLVDRGIPTLLIYGTEDAMYSDFERARRGPVGDVLGAAGPLIELHVLPGPVHGFDRLDAQRTVMDLVIEWVSSRGLAAGAAPR